MNRWKSTLYLIIPVAMLAGCVANASTHSGAQAPIVLTNTLPPIPTDIILTQTPAVIGSATPAQIPGLVASVTATPTEISPPATASPTPNSAPTKSQATAIPTRAQPTSQPASMPTEAPMDYTVQLSGVAENVRMVYALGQSLGRDPRRFSKVGDCQSTDTAYLQGYDSGDYNLGHDSALQGVIGQFAGSYRYIGPSALEANHPDILLDPAWSPRSCGDGENSLECEYRVHQPAIAIILLQPRTGDYWQEPYHEGLRDVVQETLDAGVIPVLSTMFGWRDHDGIVDETNRIIRQVAEEMNIPLWDFYESVKHLPDHGSDGNLLEWHMSISPNDNLDFSDPGNFQYAMTVRNFETLQVLDIIWREVMQ
jgi:hypothetical protein